MFVRTSNYLAQDFQPQPGTNEFDTELHRALNP